MKRYLRRKSITEKGITLVALVVTIIVLLILAGVTLNLVLNNNGLIGRAKQGAAAYQNASLNEQVELDKGAEIIDDVVKDMQVPEEVIPQIKDKDSNIIVAEQISNHYGDKVIYNNQEYQLFYVDTQGKFGEAGRIYLQSTTYIDEVKPETYNDATGLTDTSSLIYKLNPDWARLIGDTLKTDTSGKYKGVAYLCNTANWTDTYVSATDKTRGVWAIGAAPVEMFCASYNAKIQPESEFSAKAYTEENGSVGYRYKPTLVNQYTTEEGYGNTTDGTNYPLSTGANNMYNTDSGKRTWLASPYVAAYFWISIVEESSSALGGAQLYWRRHWCATNSFSTI